MRPGSGVEVGPADEHGNRFVSRPAASPSEPPPSPEDAPEGA